MRVGKAVTMVNHYHDVIMTTMASQITSLTVVYSTVYIQMQIKENIKAPRHWPLCGEFTGTGEFPAQRACYAENVSIWWRHHVWNLFCHLKPKFLDQEVTTSWLRSLLNKIFIYACMWHECPLSPRGVQLFLNYWLVCLPNQFKFRDKHCELLYKSLITETPKFNDTSLLSLVALKVVVMTLYDDTADDKVSMITTSVFNDVCK